MEELKNIYDSLKTIIGPNKIPLQASISSWIRNKELLTFYSIYSYSNSNMNFTRMITEGEQIKVVHNREDVNYIGNTDYGTLKLK